MAHRAMCRQEADVLLWQLPLLVVRTASNDDGDGGVELAGQRKANSRWSAHVEV
jgi:hypothetical protein